MPDQTARFASGDSAFQSTDQAFIHGLSGREPAATSTYAPHPHDHYDAPQTTANSTAHSATNQAPALEGAVRYPDYSQPAEAPVQFPAYGFNPGGPLVWDWDSSIEFPEFANQYEPQGELVQELQNQSLPTNDFSIPLPVTGINSEALYQSPQPVQTTPSAGAQNLLSPPPKPPSRPALQAGMKRKAESEPNSAASQALSLSTEQQQPAAKRPNKSRSSSSASIPSPAVATASDARPASLPKTKSAPAISETAPQPNANTATEVPRRKEPSKGTGPLGRVIDVSKPRRIVESPAGLDILPAGKVFPIQIGSELFRLSGASISSDGKL